jgi:hypothetical protein
MEVPRAISQVWRSGAAMKDLITKYIKRNQANQQNRKQKNKRWLMMLSCAITKM